MKNPKNTLCITRKDIEKMMRLICPMCSFGRPREFKIGSLVDTWRITCPDCAFSITHNIKH